jgi:hypothetical protein
MFCADIDLLITADDDTMVVTESVFSRSFARMIQATGVPGPVVGNPMRQGVKNCCSPKVQEAYE